MLNAEWLKFMHELEIENADLLERLALAEAVIAAAHSYPEFVDEWPRDCDCQSCLAAYAVRDALAAWDAAEGEE